MEEIVKENHMPNTNETLTSSDTALLSNISFQDENLLHLPSKEKSILNPSRTNKRSNSCLKSTADQDLSASNLSDESLENLTAIPIQLSDTLRQYLDDDCSNVNKKRKLSKLPAEPNIISVLEDFVRNYGKLLYMSDFFDLSQYAEALL